MSLKRWQKELVRLELAGEILERVDERTICVFLYWETYNAYRSARISVPKTYPFRPPRVDIVDGVRMLPNEQHIPYKRDIHLSTNTGTWGAPTTNILDRMIAMDFEKEDSANDDANGGGAMERAQKFCTCCHTLVCRDNWGPTRSIEELLCEMRKFYTFKFRLQDRELLWHFFQCRVPDEMLLHIELFL